MDIKALNKIILCSFYREVSRAVYGGELTEPDIFGWQDDVSCFTERRRIIYFVNILLKVR